MPAELKLGTRRSLLARAQSAWVAREIERLNPGLQVTLVGIDTRGDKILDVPLRAVEGKEFFVAEIDDALRTEQVDFTVHSLKDLSLDRPAEFTLAAVPRRENPRDVVIFGPGVETKLRNGQTLRIGTSAPRRLENLPPFLEHSLPRVGPAPRLEFLEIRGNVHTRLARIHETTDRGLDGVVLALAGLIRLWRDTEGRATIAPLLEHARWMVLPLAECPPAPGQGALAVECRTSDVATLTALRKLHDPGSAHHVHRERALLAAWGGGCHQKFGAVSVEIPSLGDLNFIRGTKPDGNFVDTIEWNRPVSPTFPPRPFFPGGTTRIAKHGPSQISGPERPGPEPETCVFVAHSRAYSEAFDLSRKRVWTSGTHSWLKLAARGIWVEGCGDGLGFAHLKPLLAEPLLALDPLPQWSVLTHDQGRDEWVQSEGISSVFCTYAIEFDTSHPQAVSHCFWGSRAQIDAWLDRVPVSVHHACGAGKTLDYLRGALKARGGNPTAIAVFPSMKEWKKWLES